MDALRPRAGRGGGERLRALYKVCQITLERIAHGHILSMVEASVESRREESKENGEGAARAARCPRTGHAATRLLRDRFVFIQQEGQGKGYTCRNDEHHEVLNRLGQAQQDTEDAGNARTGSGEVREGTHKARPPHHLRTRRGRA